MASPVISVVIPCYNAAAFLGEALRSVLAQTRTAEEVIVVDDGSIDGSVAIAREVEGVAVLDLTHGGVSRARNAGVGASTGGLLAFLDADDTWDPRKLELQEHMLESDPELGLVLCRHVYAFEGPIPPWFRGPRDGSIAPGYVLTSGLIRRSTWDRVGPFDPNMTHGEDGDWLMRAIDSKVKVGVVEQPLLTYRIHGSNASGQATAVRSGVLHALRESLHRKHEPGAAHHAD